MSLIGHNIGMELEERN